MMLTLTTKMNLFIQRMMESEEQAQWGVELLLKREDFEEYFDHLGEAGLFVPDPSKSGNIRTSYSYYFFIN